MASLTLPSDPLSFTITGDIDVLNALNVDNGDGTIYIRNGGLYVEGLTDLDKTTINTTDGKFNVIGSNKIEFNVSSSIEQTATANSFLTTTSGTLILSATDSSSGKVTILANGSGTDSVLINATNTSTGQITITSAGSSTSTDAVKILATDTTDGNILIQGSGNFTSSNPAIKLYTDNSSSGKIQIESAGSSSTIDSISLLASGITNGNILIQGKGTNTNHPAIKLYSDNATSGQIFIQADGNIADAIHLLANDATNGGINIEAIGGPIVINTTNISSGISIATTTVGVPVSIGTSSSVTTINGNLIVSGTRTELNTETLTVKDNVILLNSGNGELGLDAGIVIRRFQDPNGSATGDVVTNPNPIQESGAFQAGSATPATLKLSAFASSTTDFYNGWWIKVTSGTGIDQVRRIKAYNGTTKVATTYVTSDNVAPFIDGLDLIAAPAAADTYSLYSAPYTMNYYDESQDTYNFATVALVPDPVSAPGISTALVQQYQNVNTGALDVFTKIYNNAHGTASTTTITFTLLGHGQVANNKVKVSNSSAFTPTITTGLYTITSATTDTFTITVAASTTSTTASSATLELYNTSIITANIIQPHNNDFPLTIEGISCVEDIVIPKTSTSLFTLSTCTEISGAYMILVGDLNNTDGAFAVFAVASSGTGGSISRIVSSKGNDGQRLQATYTTGNKVQIQHSPAGSGAGSYTYRVRISSAL